MTDKSAAAARELVERWMGEKHPITMQSYVSDLTALISEHYYPKEFTEWVSGTGWQYHMKFKIWTLGMTADKMVKATTDELYEVWKENER
jgi:hypothetical protein